MRGLKQKVNHQIYIKYKSHLLQMRGLKPPVWWNIRHSHKVASFTDAWIETVANRMIQELNGVASFTDAWIETPEASRINFAKLSHLLQMRGLKPGIGSVTAKQISRIFYRCVD